MVVAVIGVLVLTSCTGGAAPPDPVDIAAAAVQGVLSDAEKDSQKTDPNLFFRVVDPAKWDSAGLDIDRLVREVDRRFGGSDPGFVTLDAVELARCYQDRWHEECPVGENWIAAGVVVPSPKNDSIWGVMTSVLFSPRMGWLGYSTEVKVLPDGSAAFLRTLWSTAH